MVDLETAGRDYDVYVELMSNDDVIEQKISDITDDGQRFDGDEYLLDHGCSDGSILAELETLYPQMDLVGIDLSDQLLERAQARKQEQGHEYGLVKTDIRRAAETLEQPDAIVSSSLCHEIYSYGSEPHLQQYLEDSFDHLEDGGMMVIRDVIGPSQDTTWLWLNDDNGYRTNGAEFGRPDQQEQYLDDLSTLARFEQFCEDHTSIDTSEEIIQETREQDGKTYMKMDAEIAAEYLLTKDYTDNWDNEMQETFAFWDLETYEETLETIGFEIEDSETYTNKWIRENRFENNASIRPALDQEDTYPPTNIVIAARKPHQ